MEQSAALALQARWSSIPASVRARKSDTNGDLHQQVARALIARTNRAGVGRARGPLSEAQSVGKDAVSQT
jgi:hypothetical protein